MSSFNSLQKMNGREMLHRPPPPPPPRSSVEGVGRQVVFLPGWLGSRVQRI
jgi:hypothetical protein